MTVGQSRQGGTAPDLQVRPGRDVDVPGVDAGVDARPTPKLQVLSKFIRDRKLVAAC